MKWVVGSGTHGCWLGSYEYSKQRLLRGLIRPGDVVYDIGANVGFYTLLQSVLVRDSGHVVGFEPLPRNLSYLYRHVEMNRRTNCTVLPLAVGEQPDRARFRLGAHPSVGSLAPTGEIDVDVTSLDDQVYRRGIPGPALIKMDIEGGELAALRGGRRLLAERRPVVVLATHGADIHAQRCTLLREVGYRLASLDSRPLDRTDEVVATP
jgi:FkbM family methyltransferase